MINKKGNFDIYDLEGTLYEKDLLTIRLIITNDCNQACYYCLCKSHPEVIKRHTTFTKEDFYKVIDFIEKQDRKRLEFYFFGGEPTLHPNLLEYIDILRKEIGESLSKVTILTNLSESLDYYKSLGDVNLTVSFHTEEVEKSKWIEWWERAYALKDNINILKVVLTENNLEDIMYLTKKYQSQFPNIFEIQTIYQLSDEYIKHAKKLVTEELFTTGSDNIRLLCDETLLVMDGKEIPNEKYCDFETHKNFQCMMCKAGFWIMESGDVIRCSSDIRTKRPMMNIFKDEIKKLDMWGLCTNKSCNCEEGYPKISIKKYLEDFNERIN